jgi:hypothetical protein
VIARRAGIIELFAEKMQIEPIYVLKPSHGAAIVAEVL